MGATTMGCAQCRVNCPKTCAGLGAVKVMTASAGKTGPATVAAVSSAGQPEGRSTARIGRVAALDPLERRQRQAFQRRLEAGADNGVDDQIGFERGFVPGQVFGCLDDVDEAVRGTGQFAPGLRPHRL